MNKMEEKVLSILLKNYTKISRNGGIAKVIYDHKFEDIAKEVVELFSLNGVSKSFYCINKQLDWNKEECVKQCDICKSYNK